MYPRVDPIKAVDAQLRALTARMVDCETPVEMGKLLAARDHLLERRFELSSGRESTSGPP